MSDDKQMQYIRAKEVLAGADWVFTDFVKGQLQALIDSPLEDREGREMFYMRARAAGEIKAQLERVVENYELEMKQAEKKAERVKAREERRRGR